MFLNSLGTFVRVAGSNKETLDTPAHECLEVDFFIFLAQGIFFVVWPATTALRTAVLDGSSGGEGSEKGSCGVNFLYTLRTFPLKRDNVGQHFSTP